jgi:hypothetical protein
MSIKGDGSVQLLSSPAAIDIRDCACEKELEPLLVQHTTPWKLHVGLFSQPSEIVEVEELPTTAGITRTMYYEFILGSSIVISGNEGGALSPWFDPIRPLKSQRDG